MRVDMATPSPADLRQSWTFDVERSTLVPTKIKSAPDAKDLKGASTIRKNQRYEALAMPIAPHERFKCPSLSNWTGRQFGPRSVIYVIQQNQSQRDRSINAPTSKATSRKKKAIQQSLQPHHQHLNHMKQALLLLTSSIAMTCFANAATITYYDSVLNDTGSEVTQWRTSTTNKSMDIDGDNIYGTFGGIAYGDAVVGAMTFIGAQSQVGPFAGYATIDDINGGVDRQVRTTSNSGAAGSDIVMYTFELNTAVAANQILRVGIATDGLDNGSFAPGSIGLNEVGGSGLAERVTVADNAIIDMYFFDVTGGVSAGTQFQVFADSGTADFVTHQFVSLDVVPEPSSAAALIGLCSLALVLRRRR
jgi:hypothetical protein